MNRSLVFLQTLERLQYFIYGNKDFKTIISIS